MVVEGLCSITSEYMLEAGSLHTRAVQPPGRRCAMRMQAMGEAVRRALIFDLDGVLADTAQHHYRSWQQLAHRLGLTFSSRSNGLLLGRSREDALTIFLRETGADGDITPAERKRLLQWKNEYFHRSIEGLGEDDLNPGVGRLLGAAQAQGVPVGLASSSRNARLVCERLGILDSFTAVADGRSGLRPKPEPDLFLWVAGALGVLPHECTVIEDAPAGVEAAKRGGFRTVAVGDAAAPGSADLHLEDLSVASLGLLLDGEPSMAVNHE